MTKFSITIDQTSVYQVTIEAEDEDEAKKLALNQFSPEYDAPDYVSDPEVSNVEEIDG